MTRYYVTQTYTQVDGQYVEAKSEKEALELCKDCGGGWHDVDTFDYELIATKMAKRTRKDYDRDER